MTNRDDITLISEQRAQEYSRSQDVPCKEAYTDFLAGWNAREEEVEALTKELEEYKLGASVEARMGDEARSEVEALRKELESLKAPMKHYSGKVYDLTQTNFNRVLAELVAVKAERDERAKAVKIWIQADAQSRDYANKMERRHQKLKECLEYYSMKDRFGDEAFEALTRDEKLGEGEKGS